MDAPTRRRPAPLVVVLFAAAVGLLAGMVWSLAAPTDYSATTTVFLSTRGVRAVPDLQQQAGLEQQVRDSSASVATAPIVLEPVARELGTTVGDLAHRVTADRQADTALVSIRVEDPSAYRAAAIANAVARRLVAVAPSLAPATASRDSSIQLTQIERARAATASSAPGLVPVLLGLVVGGGVAALVLLAVWSREGRPPAGGGLAAPSLL